MEPEIVDLVTCLKSMGADISGEGTDTITIRGVDKLNGATHSVIMDRIELGTYMLAPVIAGGEVELIGGKMEFLEAFCGKLTEAGVEISKTTNGLKVKRKLDTINSVDVKTAVYPGFPTDLQAQIMVLLCKASKESFIQEDIFENRFMHVAELNRMGAQISIRGNKVLIKGNIKFASAELMATDLRASVSLILAALTAKGKTIINRIYHLDRGYEELEKKLKKVGAKIRRIK